MAETTETFTDMMAASLNRVLNGKGYVPFASTGEDAEQTVLDAKNLISQEINRRMWDLVSYVRSHDDPGEPIFGTAEEVGPNDDFYHGLFNRINETAELITLANGLLDVGYALPAVRAQEREAKIAALNTIRGLAGLPPIGDEVAS